jgi:hypothetical protein
MNLQKFSLMTVLTTLAASSLACGNSPLLNHTKTVAMRPVARDCPLELTKSGDCASFDWNSEPSPENENSAILRFWDSATGSSAGPFRDADGEVVVKLWMPSMGHGSSPVTVTSNGGGIYTASRVFFVMPGEWEVRVQIKKGGQIVDQATFKLTL